MADPDEKRASLVADGTLGLAELSRKRENVTKCKPQLEARLARLEELQAELQDRVQQVEAAKKELDQRPRLNEIDKRLAGLESRDLVAAQSGASPEEQIVTNEPDSSRQMKEEKQRGRKSSKLSTMCFKGEKDKENSESQQDIPRNQEPPEQLQKKESMQKSQKKVSKSKLCVRNQQKEEDEEPQGKTCLPKQKPKKGSTTVNNDDDEHEDVNNQVIPSGEGVEQRLSDTPGEGEQLQQSAEETSGPLPEPQAEKVSLEPQPTADTQGEEVPKQQPAADVPCHCKTPTDQQAEQVPIESPPADDTPSDGASKQLTAAEDSELPTDHKAKEVPIEPLQFDDTPDEEISKQQPAAEDSCDCDIPTDQQAEQVPIKPPPTDDTPSEGVSKQQPAAEDSCDCDIPTDQQAEQVPIKPPPTDDIPSEGVSKQLPAAEDSELPTDHKAKEVPIEPLQFEDTPDEEISKQQPAAEDSCDCDTPTDQQAKQVPMEPPPTDDTPGERVLKQQSAAEDSCDCEVPTNQQANQVPIEPPPTVDTPCEGVTKQKITVKDSCDCKTPNKQAKQVPIESPPTADTPCEGVTKQLPEAQDSCGCKIPTNKQAKRVPIEPPPTAGTPCKGLSKQLPPTENAGEIPTDQETQRVLLKSPPTADIPCEETIPKTPTSQCMPDKNQPSPGTCDRMDAVVICSCGCGSVIPALPRMGTSSCGCSFQSPDVQTKAMPKRASRASRRTTTEPRAQSRRASPNSQCKVPRRGFVPDASHCEPDRVQNLPPRPPSNVAPQQCSTSPVESAFTPDVFDCGGRSPRPQGRSGTPMSVDTKQRMPYGAPMQHDCIGNTVTFQRQSFSPTGTANQSRHPRRSNRDSRAFSKSRPQIIPEPSRPSTQVRRSTNRRFDLTQTARPAVPSDCGSPQGPQNNHVASQDVPSDFARCSPNHDLSTQTPTAEHRSLETCGTKGRSQSLPAFAPTHPQTSTVAEPTSEPPSSLPSGACSIGSVPQRSSVAPHNERPCAREVPVSFSDNFVGPIDTQFPQDRGPSENTCSSSCYSKRPDRRRSLSTSPTPESPPAAIGSPSSSTGQDHSQDNPSPPINVSDSPPSSFNNSLMDNKQTQPLQTPTPPCTPCRNKPPETCDVSTSFSNPMMYPPQSQNRGSLLDSDPFQGSPQFSCGVGTPTSRDPRATEESLPPDTTSVPSPQYSEATFSPWEPTADPRPVPPCALRSQSIAPSGLPSPYSRSSSPAAYGRSFQGSMPCAPPAPRQSAMPFARSNASMYNGRPSQGAPVSSRPPSASRQGNGRTRVASAAPCKQPSVDRRATDTAAALLLPCPVTPVSSVQEVPSSRPAKNSTSGSYSRESRSPSESTCVNPTNCRPGFSNEGSSDNYQPDKWGSNSGSPSGQPPTQSQYQRPSASQNPCASTCGSPMGQRTPYGSAYPRDICPSLAVPENHAPDGSFSCSHQCPAVAGTAPCPSLSTPVPEDLLNEPPRPVPDWYTPRCSHRGHSVRPYWYSNYHHPRCPNKLNTGLSSRNRRTQDRCMPPRERRPFP